MLEAIQQELAALGRFVEILQQEQQALLGADADKLLSISQKKLKQAEELHALERQRAAWLSQHGFDASSGGMDRWLAEQPASTATLWNRLLETAKTAQQTNQTNGKLIQTHLQHNQQALSALLNAANQASVYGPNGQTLTGISASPRSIGKV